MVQLMIYMCKLALALAKNMEEGGRCALALALARQTKAKAKFVDDIFRGCLGSLPGYLNGISDIVAEDLGRGRFFGIFRLGPSLGLVADLRGAMGAWGEVEGHAQEAGTRTRLRPASTCPSAHGPKLTNLNAHLGPLNLNVRHSSFVVMHGHTCARIGSPLIFICLLRPRAQAERAPRLLQCRRWPGLE